MDKTIQREQSKTNYERIDISYPNSTVDKIIIAIDPGEVTTGITVAKCLNTSRIDILEILEVNVLKMFQEIRRLQKTYADQNPYIIIEDWIQFTQIPGNQVMEFIGAVLFAFSSDINKNVLKRTPGQRNLARKVFHINTYEHDPDSLSSLLHLLSFCLDKKFINPRTLIAKLPTECYGWFYRRNCILTL